MTDLAAVARSYFQDAQRLERTEGDVTDGMTGPQWAIVYRAIAAELNKCAEEA